MVSYEENISLRSDEQQGERLTFARPGPPVWFRMYIFIEPGRVSTGTGPPIPSAFHFSSAILLRSYSPSGVMLLFLLCMELALCVLPLWNIYIHRSENLSRRVCLDLTLYDTRSTWNNSPRSRV